MKKILAMACALLMATSLAACSKPADQPVDNGGDDKPTENQVLKVAAFKGGYGKFGNHLHVNSKKHMKVLQLN